MISPKEARDMLQSLSNFDATDGLPEWESKFVESVIDYAQDNTYERLTSKQLDKIEELYERRITKDPNRRFHDTRNNRY